MYAWEVMVVVDLPCGGGRRWFNVHAHSEEDAIEQGQQLALFWYPPGPVCIVEANKLFKLK